jgi:hypothetical protein
MNLEESIMQAIEEVATGKRTEWIARLEGEEFIPVVISITKEKENERNSSTTIEQ